LNKAGLTNKYLLLAVISVLIVVVDQVTKMLVVSKISVYTSVAVIPGVFNLTHIYNPGGAFGFLAGETSNLRHIFFLTASVIAMGMIVYLYAKVPTGYRFLSSGLALILGGAVGNVIDRIRLREVIDFLDFHFKGNHWPAFNVADSAITLGILIFIYHLLFNKMPE